MKDLDLYLDSRFPAPFYNGQRMQYLDVLLIRDGCVVSYWRRRLWAEHGHYRNLENVQAGDLIVNLADYDQWKHKRRFVGKLPAITMKIVDHRLVIMFDGEDVYSCFDYIEPKEAIARAVEAYGIM